METNLLLKTVLVLCRFGSVLCTLILEKFKWKLYKIKLTKCTVLYVYVYIYIIMQLMQLQYACTVFGSSSGNAHRRFYYFNKF